MVVQPDSDDVIVRQRRGNPSVLYLLGRASDPEQLIVRTRDEAVSQAVAFAKRQRVRAWITADGENFVLLGTFRDENGT